MSKSKKKAHPLRDEIPIMAVLHMYGADENLKRVGPNEFRSVCPVHAKADNDTAFAVNVQTNRATCYTHCGMLTTIDLVMHFDQLTMAQACKKLHLMKPQLCRMDVPQPQGPSPDVEKPEEIIPLRFLPRTVPATDYLMSRGITAETGLFFGFGIAVRGKRKGSLIVPIHWDDGTLVGYAHRKLADGERYRMSFGTPRKTLIYNIWRQPRGIPLIITEGYMDVAKLYQAGYPNAVATCGTAITRMQAQKIDEWASFAYLMYDADSAGTDGVVALSKLLKVRHRIVTLAIGDPGARSEEALRKILQTVGLKPYDTAN